MEDRIFNLFPLDHLMPRVYICTLLYFPLPNPDITRIVSSLKAGLRRTFDTLPILSGTVQLVPHSKQLGSLCVSKPWNEIDEVFHVNDITSSDLDYENLRRTHFPMTTSREHNLLSVLTSRPEPVGVGHPVMMVQINFIRNGMILIPILHHSVVDGLGSVSIMEVWATFCREEDGAEMVTDGMIDRERLMFHDETSRFEDFPEYVDLSETCGKGTRLPEDDGGKGFLKSGYRVGEYIFHSVATFYKEKMRGALFSAIGFRVTGSAPQRPKEIDSEIFFFPRSKLNALKSIVSASMASDNPSSSKNEVPSYISTNDALSALLFTCITEARKSFHSVITQQVLSFLLTVSGRRLPKPPLPEKYIGNMSLFCQLDLPLHIVTPEIRSMASIACQIRKRISQLDEGHVKRLVGAINRLDDVGSLSSSWLWKSRGWGFMITPWTGQRFCSIDWGSEIGIKCERVRIPKLPSLPILDGCLIILPELTIENSVEDEAGLEVAIVLEKRVMLRLRGMKEWTTWAQWRCS